jgi:hypothetical protein
MNIRCLHVPLLCKVSDIFFSYCLVILKIGFQALLTGSCYVYELINLGVGGMSLSVRHCRTKRCVFKTHQGFQLF